MANKELLTLIQKRQALFPKQLSGAIIPDEDVKLILEAAHRAPTHKLTQPWRFTVLQGDAKAKFVDFVGLLMQETWQDEARWEAQKPKMEEFKTQVSHLISIALKPTPEANLPEWEELAAVSCAVQNLWLGATALGYGGYWSTGLFFNKPAVRKYFGYSDDIQHLGYFMLGVPAEGKPESKRKPLEEVITWLR